MSTFTQEFYARLMKWEGGYQNHSSDTGNYNSCGSLVGTNKGVTSKAIETLMGVKCADTAFMQGITDEYAMQFYQKYWEFYRIDEITDQTVAELVMNCFMGLPKKAGESVQKACNKFQSNLTVDGAMGSKTLAALNSLAAQNMPAIYNAIREEWIAYLLTTQIAFRQGLMNRTNDLFKPLLAGLFTTSAPVADTGGLERAKLILTGAAKGNTADIIAIVAALIGTIAVFFAIRKITQKPSMAI